MSTHVRESVLDEYSQCPHEGKHGWHEEHTTPEENKSHKPQSGNTRVAQTAIWEYTRIITVHT